MIVNCPKCEFEQPIDEYCAQCGAPLRKLVELERLKKKNSSNLPIYIAAFAFFIIAGAWLSLQLKNEDGDNQTTSIEQEGDTSNVRVSLKSAKIKADRKAREAKVELALNKQKALKIARKSSTPVVKKAPQIRNQSLNQKVQVVKDEVPSDSNTSPLILKKLSLVSLASCENTSPLNKLNKADLAKIKSCYYVISTKTFNNSGEFLAQGDSFETILSWDLSDDSIALNASFSSEATEGSQTESLNLIKSDDTRAFIFANPFIGLVEKENLSDDAKANIFSSALFGFTEKDSLTFFLVSE